MLAFESLVTVEFLVCETTVPEEFTLFRKIFTPVYFAINLVGFRYLC